MFDVPGVQGGRVRNPNIKRQCQRLVIISEASVCDMSTSASKAFSCLFSGRNLFATNATISFTLGGLSDWLEQVLEAGGIDKLR